MEFNKNLDNDLDDFLFNELLLVENIEVPPEKLNNKVDTYLIESLKKKNEEKCISEGFIKKDSINILKKSIGTVKGSRFNGGINFVLLYKALICNPKIGSIIKCQVKMINNKLGLLGNNGPLTIIVGKQFHNNPLLLDEINIDDIIEIKIIDSKYSLNDKEIKIIGKLKNDLDNLPKKNSNDENINNIDVENMDDLSDIESKNDIDQVDLESLDGIETEEDEMEEDEDLDDLDNIDDEDLEDVEEDDQNINEDDDVDDDEIENDDDDVEDDEDEMDDDETDVI